MSIFDTIDKVDKNRLILKGSVLEFVFVDADAFLLKVDLPKARDNLV
jgi:hypothetical protein